MTDRAKYKEVTVGGRRFEFELMDAVSSAMMLIKLRGIASNALRGTGNLDVADLQKAFSAAGDSDKKNDLSAFVEIIAGIIDSIGEDVFQHVSGKIIAKTRIYCAEAGKWRQVIEIQDFNGATFDYMQVVFFGLRYQYADFLQGLSSKFGGAKA